MHSGCVLHRYQGMRQWIDCACGMQGTNPVYNLLPDILSSLGGEPGLEPQGFQEIMRHLLQYVGKERHADGLVDKLCARFQAGAEASHGRNLAFCLAQV